YRPGAFWIVLPPNLGIRATQDHLRLRAISHSARIRPLPSTRRNPVYHSACAVLLQWGDPARSSPGRSRAVAPRVKCDAFFQMNVQFDCLPGCDSQVVSSEREESRSRHLSLQLVSSGGQLSYGIFAGGGRRGPVNNLSCHVGGLNRNSRNGTAVR